MAKCKDITGQTFGLLTIVSISPERVGNDRRWLCICECGGTNVVAQKHLVSGATSSCGCRKNYGNRRTHGMSKTPIYKIWWAMNQRCNDKGHRAYPGYGGRGITLCASWHKFENFYADMGDRPPGRSLDRRDNDKGYSLDNCRWATYVEQNNNTSSNKYITYAGRTLSYAQWSAVLGGSKYLVQHRIAAGWSHEDAVATPVGRKPAYR